MADSEHVRAVQHLKPAFDVEFFLFQRRLEARMADAKSEVMTVLQRVKFEELKAQGDQLCLKAREIQTEFWAEIQKPIPSMFRLASLGMNVERTIASCEESFTAQLAMNPHSVHVLRRYAQFQFEVC